MNLALVQLHNTFTGSGPKRVRNTLGTLQNNIDTETFIPHSRDCSANLKKRRVEMNLSKLLITSVVMSLLLTSIPSLATTVAMGGTQSLVNSNAALAGAYQAFNFQTAAPLAINPIYTRWLRADILAAAYVPANRLGSAEVNILVSPAVTNTQTIATAGLPPITPETATTTLRTTAGGQVTARASKTTANGLDTDVLSYAYIHSDARLVTNAIAVLPLDEDFVSVNGQAFIRSGIGSTNPTGPTVPSTQAQFQTNIDNFIQNVLVFNNYVPATAVHGQFSADAYADGQASYDASTIILTGVDTGNRYQAAGSIASTTSMEATNEGTTGLIGGDQSITGPVFIAAGWANGAALAELLASSSVARTGAANSIAQGYVAVAAQRDFGGNGASDIYGSADSNGVSASTVEVALAGVPLSRGTTAFFEGSLTGDAHAYRGADESKAYSIANANSIIGPTAHTSTYNLNAGAYSRRTGYLATKSGAEAFSNEAYLLATTAYDNGGTGITPPTAPRVGGTSAEISTDSISGLSGIGAGSFLQFAKNGAAYGTVDITGNAIWNEANEAVPGLPLATTTSNINTVILGPKPVGASTDDGSGVYASVGTYLQSNYNTWLPWLGQVTTAYDPGQVSTSIGSREDLKWVDGTNSNQFNGPGFSFTAPSYEGSGVTTGPTVIPITNPVQRQTTTTLNTVNTI